MLRSLSFLRSRTLTALGLSVMLAACSPASKDGGNSRDQEPDTIITPGPDTIGSGGNSKPIITTPLPVQPIVLKSLRERSANEFCTALSEFFQNYAAERAKTAHLSLIKENGVTCRVDSETQNIGYHMSVLFTKDNTMIRLAVNLITEMQGDVYTASTLYLDRIVGNESRSFNPESTDDAIGDFSMLRSDLSWYVALTSENFRIHGLDASEAYARIRASFAPGRNRALVQNPLLRLEMSGDDDLRITEIAGAYFQSEDKAYLRCLDLACLQDGLSYEIKGLDIVLFSKPYYGTSNVPLRANARFPITADLL